MSTITVGPGKQYTNLVTAINAAAAGDTLLVDAGVYTNISVYINKNLTLSGVGGMAVLDSNADTANGKGYFVTNGNINIDHFEFRNAKGASNNIAGIRYESGVLNVKSCYFHHNQNGILCALDTAGSIIVDSSEFAFNGYGDGQTHNFYCNGLALCKITNSYFHDVNNGNQVKSRAVRSEYTNIRVHDNNAVAAWELDFPEGGVCIVTDCFIQQGAASAGNSNVMNIGAETVTHNPNSLTVKNCTIVNDKASGTLLFNPKNLSYSFDGCKIYKGSTSFTLPTGMTNTTTLTTRPAMDTSSPWKGTIIPAPPPPPPPPPPSTNAVAKISTVVTLTQATMANATIEPAVIDNNTIEVLLHQAKLTPATSSSKTTIDVSGFGVKSSEYSTRIAMIDVTGGVKIVIDGNDCVVIGGVTSSQLSAANFVFAS